MQDDLRIYCIKVIHSITNNDPFNKFTASGVLCIIVVKLKN